MAGRRCAGKNARVVAAVTPEHPAFPAQWFIRLLRAHPGDRALLPPSPAGLTASLTPASPKLDTSVEMSGRHDLAVRSEHVRLTHRYVPPQPIPRFVTFAKRPSELERDAVNIDGSAISENQNIVIKGGLTDFRVICLSGRFFELIEHPSSLRGALATKQSILPLLASLRSQRLRAFAHPSASARVARKGGDQPRVHGTIREDARYVGFGQGKRNVEKRESSARPVRERAQIPAVGRRGYRLRHLSSGPQWDHHQLERRRPAHQGLRRRRGRRPAFRDVLFARRSRGRIACGVPRHRARDGEVRGRRLASPQGRFKNSWLPSSSIRFTSTGELVGFAKITATSPNGTRPPKPSGRASGTFACWCAASPTTRCT